MKLTSVLHGPAIHYQSELWICSSCLSAKRSIIVRSQQQRFGRQQRGFAWSSSWAHTEHNATTRDGRLPDFPARTRFAPSPTGIMHIGGLRTALFSYLLARRTGGQFVLRIEDTDQKRFVPGAIERLCEDLQWAGLEWDEGPVIGGNYGPYQQSYRTEIYQRHANNLLDQGTAYRCFCTPQTDGASSSAFVTSGCYQECASLGADESCERSSNAQLFTVRLKLPADVGRRKYPDLVYGNIKRLKRSPGASLSGDDQDVPNAADTILVKSDGTPTYHFANVVDDHLMKITHVIRGTEWMASTPLHYDLYRAFGWQPPLFAHVGLLLDKDKAKLSKRNADLVLDVRSLQDQNDVLPETLCNFLALQGWSNPTRNDVMNMQELIQAFDLKFTTGNTMVSMEKLWFLQKHHVERRSIVVKQSGDAAPILDLANKVAGIVSQRYPDFDTQSSGCAPADFCATLLLVDDKSFQSASQFVDRNHYIFSFDASRVPTGNVEAGTDEVIEDMVKRIDSTLGDKHNHATTPITLFAQLEQHSTAMHHIFVEAFWLAVLGKSKQAELHSVLTDTTTAAAVAEKLASSEDDANVLLKQYQGLQKAVMKRLRQILCCGSPGPSMGLVIALLGLDECKRRMELMKVVVRHT